MLAKRIGKFYAPQKQVEPTAAIATHLAKFRDPRMRAAMVARLDKGGDGLDPPVLQAVERLKQGP